MPARAIWTGTIKVDDAAVPVKLYSAVEDRSIHFHLLDRKTQTRVKQRMVNPETGKGVPKEEIRKGVEIEPGRFVILTPEEQESVRPQDSRDIRVTRFLPPDAIMHQWFERPYFLGPDGDDKSYFALAEALASSDRDGLAHWVMRKKEYNGALRSRDGYLVLITLRYSEEVVTAADLPALTGRDLDPREIQMAEQLISVLADEYRPEQFRDEYRDRVMSFIENKARGQRPKLQKVETKKPATSLMDMLSASLNSVRGGKVA